MTYSTRLTELATHLMHHVYMDILVAYIGLRGPISNLKIEVKIIP